MKISARYKAILDLMTIIFADKEPADNIINNYFRERRFIGSGDRRFISEKIWDIIRHRRRLTFAAQSEDCRKLLAVYVKDENSEEIFDGSEYGLPLLSFEEKEELQNLNDKPYPPAVESECPDWLFDKIQNVDLCKSLNTTATADFRVNRGNRETAAEHLKQEGFDVDFTPYSPIGLRAKTRINLNNCVAYQDGIIEVQDEASQIAALLCDVSAQDKVIDYCCGAGGKSLAIASLLHGKGMIEAHDINRKRLEQLKPRMQRLQITNIKTIEWVNEQAQYTRFIIDAPCSGTGTWRRAPDAKYRLSELKLDELVHTQTEILDIAYRHTAIGGRIIYITCSILDDENGHQIEHFLKKYPDMQLLDMPKLWQSKINQPWPCGHLPWLQLNPIISNTDGFFVAVMKKC